MRPIRPPPVAKPPGPPAHLFEPSSDDRGYSYEPHSARGYGVMTGPGAGPSGGAGISVPSVGNPRLGVYDERPKMDPAGGGIGSMGGMNSSRMDPAHGREYSSTKPSDLPAYTAAPSSYAPSSYGSVPEKSSKIDFDKDVEEQMRQIEDNIRKMLAGGQSDTKDNGDMYIPSSNVAPKLMSQYSPQKDPYPNRDNYSKYTNNNADLPPKANIGYNMERNVDMRMDGPQGGKPVPNPYASPPPKETGGGFTLGPDKDTERQMKRARQEAYKRELDKQAVGMDKHIDRGVERVVNPNYPAPPAAYVSPPNSKRLQQEEYKRFLDAQMAEKEKGMGAAAEGPARDRSRLRGAGGISNREDVRSDNSVGYASNVNVNSNSNMSDARRQQQEEYKRFLDAQMAEKEKGMGAAAEGPARDRSRLRGGGGISNREDVRSDNSVGYASNVSVNSNSNMSDARRQQQEEYKRFLDAQMAEKERERELEKRMQKGVPAVQRDAGVVEHRGMAMDRGMDRGVDRGMGGMDRAMDYRGPGIDRGMAMDRGMDRGVVDMRGMDRGMAVERAMDRGMMDRDLGMGGMDRGMAVERAMDRGMMDRDLGMGGMDRAMDRGMGMDRMQREMAMGAMDRGMGVMDRAGIDRGNYQDIDRGAPYGQQPGQGAAYAAVPRDRSRLRGGREEEPYNSAPPAAYVSPPNSKRQQQEEYKRFLDAQMAEKEKGMGAAAEGPVRDRSRLRGGNAAGAGGISGAEVEGGGVRGVWGRNNDDNKEERRRMQDEYRRLLDAQVQHKGQEKDKDKNKDKDIDMIKDNKERHMERIEEEVPRDREEERLRRVMEERRQHYGVDYDDAHSSYPPTYRGDDQEPAYLSHANAIASSPNKSPSKASARERLVQDIYGIGAGGGNPDLPPNWKPSGQFKTERQKVGMQEMKILLDQQIREERERKEKAKAEEKEKERQILLKEQQKKEKEAQEKMEEEKKKKELLLQQQKDMEELQRRTEMEALARKNRKHTHSSQTPPANNNTHTSQVATASSPLRELVQKDGERRDYTSSHVSDRHVDSHGDRGYGNREIGDSVDNMLRGEYRDRDRGYDANARDSRDRGAGAGYDSNNRGGGYDTRDRGYDPRDRDSRYDPRYDNRYDSRYDDRYDNRGGASYDRERDRRGGGYDDHRDSYGRGPGAGGGYNRNDPYGGRSSYDRDVREDYSHGAAEGDVSLVCESRLVPPNPYKGSIIPNLMPVPIRSPAQPTNPSGYVSKARKEDEVEQSLASESMMYYLGQRTPLPSRGSLGVALDNRNVGVDSRAVDSRPVDVPVSKTNAVDNISSSNKTAGGGAGGVKVVYDEQNAYTSSQRRPRSAPKVPPESLPPAGMSTQTTVPVKNRVIPQVSVPTADEPVPNRMYVPLPQGADQPTDQAERAPRSSSSTYTTPSVAPQGLAGRAAGSSRTGTSENTGMMGLGVGMETDGKVYNIPLVVNHSLSQSDEGNMQAYGSNHEYASQTLQEYFAHPHSHVSTPYHTNPNSQPASRPTSRPASSINRMVRESSVVELEAVASIKDDADQQVHAMPTHLTPRALLHPADVGLESSGSRMGSAGSVGVDSTGLAMPFAMANSRGNSRDASRNVGSEYYDLASYHNLNVDGAGATDGKVERRRNVLEANAQVLLTNAPPAAARTNNVMSMPRSRAPIVEDEDHDDDVRNQELGLGSRGNSAVGMGSRGNSRDGTTGSRANSRGGGVRGIMDVEVEGSGVGRRRNNVNDANTHILQSNHTPTQPTSKKKWEVGDVNAVLQKIGEKAMGSGVERSSNLGVGSSQEYSMDKFE
eukprot:gene26007-31406_t